MNKIIDFFLSLKLTVTLLALSMILVFAGTLAQVDKDIWIVMDEYFRCLIAWIEIPVFFPRTWDIPEWKIPFPGGFLIGWLLVINLVTVHWASFKIQAKGGRKIAGIVFLLLGVLVTCGVMFGWGSASVAATESDAFWRVFLRLGRGTLAAVVLFVGCALLYRKRAGMVLLHGGILFLLIGEFATALYAVEASMTIREGQTVNYIEHTRTAELVFIDSSHPDHDTVIVVSQDDLEKEEMLSPEKLPCDIRVHRCGTALEDVDIELIDRASGESLGQGVFMLQGRHGRVMVGGKEYAVALRRHREYLVSPSGNPYSIKLLDFVHEKYEGTQMPKDFASRIVLVNEGDDVERELRIWMNNPLRYARRTFYQSGFIPDDSGTILQVVRNDSWMIPYLSCMIVFVGMAAQLIQSLGRYLRRDV